MNTETPFGKVVNIEHGKILWYPKKHSKQKASLWSKSLVRCYKISFLVFAVNLLGKVVCTVVERVITEAKFPGFIYTPCLTLCLGNRMFSVDTSVIRIILASPLTLFSLKTLSFPYIHNEMQSFLVSFASSCSSSPWNAHLPLHFTLFFFFCSLWVTCWSASMTSPPPAW